MGRPVKKQRVAIFGGDERTEHLDWPDHLDIRVFPYKSPRSADRLKESLSTGSIDQLVMLTSYMGHGYESGIRQYIGNTPVVRWPRSPGELCRQMAKMFPKPEDRNPLLRPTKPDEITTGGGRGPLLNRTEVELTAPPQFEHVLVDDPPKPNETLGQALNRIIRAERMTQSELGRLLKKPQATVNTWFTGKAMPRDMGPLVDLWPELARFDVYHEHVVPPTAAESELRAAEDVKELIRSVKSEPTVARPIAHPSPPPRASLSPDVVEAVLRWKKAKDELDDAESYLRALLRGNNL